LILKKFITISIIFFVTLLNERTANAQHDPIFSQFYASNAYLNPALNGLEHRFALSLIHRNQWFGLNPYISNLLNVSIPYHDKGENAYHKGGLGLTVLNASAANGNYSQNGAYINAAYNLRISSTTKQTLTFGMQIGFMQVAGNQNSYLWGSQYDPTSSNGYNTSSVVPTVNNATYPDIGVGAIYYYNAGRNSFQPGMSMYLGIAIDHLNSPNESVFSGQSSKVPVNFKIHTGLETYIAPKINFSPNLLYSTQSSNSLLQIGGNITYMFKQHEAYLKPVRMSLGAAFRNSDKAFIFLFNIGSKQYNLGLSYDFGTSNLSSLSGKSVGTYEISFKTTAHINKKAAKTNKYHTPLM
jgi:type IX secretion system PorP/SprF family membrane protein